MISADRISKSFGGRALFSEASLFIAPRDRIGLVGPNGSGKTTLLGIIGGAGSADTGEVRRAGGISVGTLDQEQEFAPGTSLLDVVLAGTPAVNALEREAGRLAAAIGKHPPRAELMELVERQGLVHERLELLDAYEREHRARRVLAGLGFPPGDAGRDAAELSGGWRVRASLAAALASLPDLLLLDEPTNHLDLESVEWLEGYLKTFPGAFLIISHDRALLNAVTTRTVLVEGGALEAAPGNFDAFLRQWEERRRHREAAARARARDIARMERFIDRFRAKARKARQVQSRIKRLGKMEAVETVRESARLRVDFPTPPRSGRTLLTLQDVSHSFGGRPVFSGVTLAVSRGDRIALTGPNGAGKSTLLKIMAGLLAPDGGEVVPGHGLQRGAFFQHSGENLVAGRTVLEEAGAAAGLLPQSKLRSLLGRFLFTGDDVFKPVDVLSGGEKTRLALAKLLLAPPNLLLLDEPTNHLDMASREVLAGALEAFDASLVLITHDRQLIERTATRVVEIREGRAMAFEGDYHYYLSKRPAPASPPATEAAVDDRGRGGRERRREAARLRETLARDLGPLRQRVERIEAEIEENEALKGDMESRMADQDFYGSAAFGDALRDYRRTTERLERLHRRWEEAGIEIEDREARIRERFSTATE